MIRWRFVLTRLIIVIAAIALLRWGLGPVAGYVTVRALESITGAKVEIAKTRVGLFPPRIQLVDFAVADPRADKEMRDAFRADTIDLVIDGEALLRRRWVASDGRITGLQIGSRRETSGHYDQVEPEPTSISDEPSMLGKLLRSATDAVGDQAEAIVGDLETVRRSKEIQASWEEEYKSLVTRARNLEKQIRTVRDQARGIENPLRDWPQLERTLAEARGVRNELLTVRQEIDSLPDRLQAQLVRLDEAKQIDLAKVDQYVPGDLSSSDNFGIDIVAEAVRQQIQKIRSYVDGGKTVANYTIVAPESFRIRGVNHDLDPIDRPDLLVRRCQVSGLMRADGSSYVMTGVLENLTPTPEVLAEPTRAMLRLEGPEILRVEYVRDRRQGSDVDLLTLHWPQTDAKPMRLGNDYDAGISIEGGQRELWIQVQSEGDQLKGSLVSKQVGLEMNLSVHPQYAETPVAKSLQSSLAAVNEVAIEAGFEGTWNDLQLQLRTNLGQIFQRATQDAIDSTVRQARQKLAVQVERAHSEQTLALRNWVGSRQSEARSLLASADKSIEEMSQKVLDEVGDADAYLGKLRSAIRGRLK